MKCINERREFPRKSVSYPTIILCKKKEYEDIGIRGMVKNLSKKGMMVNDLLSVNVKGYSISDLKSDLKRIKLKIYLPNGNLDIEGKVRWMINGKSMGIAYTSLNKNTKGYLDNIF